MRLPVRLAVGQVLVNDNLETAYVELKNLAKTWYPQLADDSDASAKAGDA